MLMAMARAGERMADVPPSGDGAVEAERLDKAVQMASEEANRARRGELRVVGLSAHPMKRLSAGRKGVLGSDSAAAERSRSEMHINSDTDCSMTAGSASVRFSKSLTYARPRVRSRCCGRVGGSLRRTENAMMVVMQ